MAWEPRGKSGKLFYYQSRRTADARVVKQYFGSGTAAEQVAAAAERQRQLHAAQRREVEGEVARLAAVEQLTAQVAAAAGVLMEATLLANGWHRPNYGPWRRRRDDHG